MAESYSKRYSEHIQSRIDRGKADFGIEGRRIAEMDTPHQVRNYLGLGQRNLMINGDFSIWQRGGSSSTYTTQQFSADRWYHSGGDTTGGADGFGIQHTATNTDPYFLYRLEDIGNEWAGKDFVCSFYIKTSDGQNRLQYLTIDNVNYYHRQPMNDGDKHQIIEIESDIPNYKRYYLHGRFNGTYTNYHRFVFELMNYAGCVSTLAYVQVELGNTPTPFQERTYGEELILCKRYFQRYGVGAGSAPFRLVGSGNNATNPLFGFMFPVEMYGAPTVYYYGTNSLNGTFNVYAPGFATANSGTPAGVDINSYAVRWNFTSAAGAATLPHWIDVGSGNNQFGFDLYSEP